MRQVKVVAVALFAALVLMAQSAFAQGSTGTAQVRVLHRAPGVGNVDVFVDGTRTLKNIAFGATGDRVSIAAGTHRIQITPTNQAIGNTLVDTSVVLRAGGLYTIVAINGVEKVQALTLRDATKDLPTGKARVRFIHADPDVPAFNVRVTNASNPILTGQYYRSSDHVDLNAGTYAFDFIRSGSSDLLVTSQSLRFEPGWGYTLVVTRGSTNITHSLLVNANVDWTAQ